MDPTTAFCPNEHCHARGQTGQGNIGIHSQQEQRFICHECHKTFSARKGTVFYPNPANTSSLFRTFGERWRGCSPAGEERSLLAPASHHCEPSSHAGRRAGLREHGRAEQGNLFHGCA